MSAPITIYVCPPGAPTWKTLGRGPERAGGRLHPVPRHARAAQERRASARRLRGARHADTRACPATRHRRRRHAGRTASGSLASSQGRRCKAVTSSTWATSRRGARGAVRRRARAGAAVARRGLRPAGARGDVAGVPVVASNRGSLPEVVGNAASCSTRGRRPLGGGDRARRRATSRGPPTWRARVSSAPGRSPGRSRPPSCARPIATPFARRGAALTCESRSTPRARRHARPASAATCRSCCGLGRAARGRRARVHPVRPERAGPSTHSGTSALLPGVAPGSGTLWEQLVLPRLVARERRRAVRAGYTARSGAAFRWC